MAITTISWTATELPDGTILPGYTFNPWRGCKKVSDACKFCYAEALGKRNPKVLGSWEIGKPRVMAAEDYWNLPLVWNMKARLAGHRRKVFCCSLADVFEEWTGLVADTQGNIIPITLHQLRARLFEIIALTPWLDWLLLTKRPENIQDHKLEALLASKPGGHGERYLLDWTNGIPPANLWLGITAENQKYYDERRSYQRLHPAAVHFVSAEPLLGPIKLEDKPRDPIGIGKHKYRVPLWVITGGESGAHARPTHPSWTEGLRWDCKDKLVPYFFKQYGCWVPDYTPLLKNLGLDPGKAIESRMMGCSLTGKKYQIGSGMTAPMKMFRFKETIYPTPAHHHSHHNQFPTPLIAA